jgi:hypothetical protein
MNAYVALDRLLAALVAVRAEVTRLEKERDESQMWSRYYAVRAERDRLILAIRSHAPKQADAIIDVGAVSSPGEETP